MRVIAEQNSWGAVPFDEYEEPRRKPRASGYRRQPFIRESSNVVPTVAVERLKASHSPESAQLIKQTDFKIFDLPRPFEMPPGLELSPFDEYGWETGRAYESILKARQPSFATRVVFPSLKDDRVLHALSMGEFAIQLALMFHPYVVDVREQYPVYDENAYQRARAAGKNLSRHHLMTLDLMLTYWNPNLRKLRNHIVNVKHARHVPAKKDDDREIRERAIGASRESTWEQLRSDAIESRELGNYAALWSMAKSEKVRHLYSQSRRMADNLMSHSVRGSLDSVLERRAKSLGISKNTATHLFVSAVSFGFVHLDHSKRVHPRRSIPLAF
ncbi:hypothetical protein ACPWR0_14435 [Pandoraea pneumonica]|uniref:hypothetical protein n=1 Tax=Pandoraea pneumonica TaxID=2508299 RepID=UPI003CEC55A4